METSENLMPGAGMEQLTFWPEEIPASPPAQRAKRKARMMSGISGQRCIELFENAGQDGLSMRMLLEQFPMGFWTGRLTIWRMKVTPAGRPYLCLPTRWAPGTSANGFSWLPTPMHTDGTGFSVAGAKQYRKRTRRTMHWIHEAIHFYNLNKGWANPQFSEWIMGLPIGYSALEPLETPSTPT